MVPIFIGAAGIDFSAGVYYNKLNGKSLFAKENKQMSPILSGTLNLIIYFVIAVILAFYFICFFYDDKELQFLSKKEK